MAAESNFAGETGTSNGLCLAARSVFLFVVPNICWELGKKQVGGAE